MKATGQCFIRCVLWATTTALLISCSARVKNLEVDSSFTPEYLQQNGLAILGVTSIATLDTNDIALSRTLSTHVETAVREHRPDIRIVSWGSVRRKLGDGRLGPILTSVREYGSFGGADLDTLAVQLGDGVRYVFINRIESDQLSFNESDVTKQQDGESVKTGTKLTTKRTVSSTLWIYDLSSRKQVWYATIEGDIETERTVPVEEYVDVKGFLGSVINFAEAVDDIFGDAEMQRFPRPATQTSVMDKIYEKFAKELPRSDV